MDVYSKAAEHKSVQAASPTAIHDHIIILNIRWAGLQYLAIIVAHIRSAVAGENLTSYRKRWMSSCMSANTLVIIHTIELTVSRRQLTGASTPHSALVGHRVFFLKPF